MKIEIITLFPGYFDSILKESIVGRGIEKQLFEIRIINLRDFTTDKHQTADDTPYGGGGGMVLKVEPLYECLKSLGYDEKCQPMEQLILTSAAGRKLTQNLAVEYSLLQRMTIICGHYLGVDERILKLFDIKEVSIGDYVLTGGEAATAVMVDAVTRLIPGVLGNFESAMSDSHSDLLLGAPVYTRPEEFMGLKVPDVMVGGNHRLVDEYRRKESIKKTFENRPEILDNEKIELSEEEKKYIDKFKSGKKN